VMTALLAHMMDRDVRPPNRATEGYYTKIYHDNMTLSGSCVHTVLNVRELWEK
jgi:hypothetical protein